MSLRSGYVNGDNSRGRLYFTVGLPASGKSTYLNYIIKHRERLSVIISGDDFRMAINDNTEYCPRSEALVFSCMDVAILALLERGFDVYVDETSTSRPTLMRYLRLDPEATPIFIDTPKEECIRRANAANRPYLAHVIERLDKRIAKVKENWESIKKELTEQVEHRMV